MRNCLYTNIDNVEVNPNIFPDETVTITDDSNSIGSSGKYLKNVNNLFYIY